MKKLALLLGGGIFYIFCVGLQNPAAAHPYGRLAQRVPFSSNNDFQTAFSSRRPRVLVVSRRGDTAEGLPLYFDVTTGEQRPAFFEESGGLYSFLATAQETEGAVSQLHFFVPPPNDDPETSQVDVTALTPSHRHVFDDEVFFVLEGTLSFQFGDLVAKCDPLSDGCIPDTENGKWLDAGPGTFIYVPAGRVHAWANRTTAPARVLTTLIPGGADELFAKTGVPLEEGTIPIGGDENRFFFLQFGINLADEDAKGTIPEVLVVLPNEHSPQDEGLLPSVRFYIGPFGEFVSVLARLNNASGLFAYSSFLLESNSTAEPNLIKSKNNELLYILNGALLVQIKEKDFVVESDTSVYIPAGTPYALINSGGSPVRGLLISLGGNACRNVCSEFH
jgi:mannose-6-phosphate isomerase-like protein (cupin superfamily)